MQTESPNAVKAVQTTLRILESLDRLEDTRLQPIADELDLSTSAIHNHLVTLEDAGYVIKQHGKYQPSLKFFERGGRLRSQCEVYKHGRSNIDELARSTGELANLMVEENGMGIHLYLSKGEDAVVFDTHAGKIYPLHNNALGKSILAHLPDDQVTDIIESRGLQSTTDHTIADAGDLLEELETIRERGYAFDDQERLEGLRCVGAPIVVDGEVQGSVSVSGPASRIKGTYFEEDLPGKVRETADLIRITMKYS